MEPQSVFNTLDYIVIGVVLLSALLALLRGFVRELFSLIAWVGAYFAATKAYEPFIPWMHHYFKADRIAEGAAMAFVFFVVLVILMIAGSLISGLVRGQTLTNIDRILGFFYGFTRGALVVCLVYLGSVMILWPDIDEPQPLMPKEGHYPAPELLMQAKTRPYLASGGKMLLSLVPKEIIDKSLKDLEKTKEEAEQSARARAMMQQPSPAPDSVPSSTPNSPQPQPDEKTGPVDINKLFNRDSHP